MPNQGVPAGIAYVELRLSNTDFITEPVRRQTRRAADEASETLRDRLTAGAQSAAQGIDRGLSVAGAAGGAALAAGVMEGLQQAGLQGKLKAQLGLSAKESERIGKVAGDLFANAYGESMEEVNDAIKSVIQNMDGMRGASSAVLKDTAKDALNLANVMGEDVGKVTAAVAQMLKTGLAKNAKEAFDVLTVGTQKGINKAEDLLDTFIEYGTQFRKLGIDAKMATGILSQGLKAGARDADIVADALKEFSIRAVDMSDSSIAAYKALGLNGEEMSAKIAKGGASASAGLQLVLDRLRAIDDPVKREAAAVGLFGTQAEDLGQALFAIDPSKAVQSLGQVGGAADRMDKALGESANVTLEKFKRQLQQGIVNAMATSVIPAINSFIQALEGIGISGGAIAKVVIGVTALAAAWKGVQLAIAGVQAVGTVAGPMASGIRLAITNVVMFTRALHNLNLAYATNATLGARLGGAIRAQIVLWQAQAVATNRSTAAVIANAAATKIAAAATRAWSIAMGIFNAVMSANPIVLIGIAIVALIALLVLAYNKVGWFRDFVNAAFAMIKNAIMTAWNFIKPTFMQFVHILTVVVGTALRWYWAYVKFVFTTVWTIIQFSWNLIKGVFLAIAGFLQGPLRIAWIVIQNTVKVVWIAIQIYIKIAWTLIKGYFTAIKWYVQNVLAPIFRWLYNNVIKPIWSAIQLYIKVQWNIIKGYFNAIKWAIQNILAPIFRWFYNSIIKPIWNSVKTHISNVWNNGIKPTFNALKSLLNTLGGAFKTAVSAIKTQWDKLQGVAKTPVNFVIGIYNKGIVGLVNKLADFAGVKTRLNEIPKLERGGSLGNPMAAGPMMTNGPLAIVGEGRKQYPEYVIPTDPRYRKRAAALWAMAGQKVMGKAPESKWLRGKNQLGGEGIAFRRGGSLQALAFGGIIGDFVKGVKDFTIGNISKGAETLLNKVLGGNVPGTGVFRDVVAGIPGWIKKSVLAWVKAKVATFGGGKGMQAALRWAGTQDNKPYQWGGNGNPSWDCSGFMSAIESVIRGQKPHRRWSTHPFHGGASNPMPGWHRGARSGFMIGVTGAGVGHVAGTLLGKNVESSGSNGVQVGSPARGFNDGMFPYQYGFKADTGSALMPGWNPPILNKTGHPEPILNPSQARLVERSLDATVSGAGQTIDNRTYVYPQRANFTVQDLEALERRRDAKARVGRPK